jgi:hypothetical protein
LRELVGVRVAIGLDSCDDALVIAVADSFAQLALGLDLDARAAVLAEPGLGAERPLRRPELEHLARAPQRFPDRPSPVDLVRGHDRGTSR